MKTVFIMGAGASAQAGAPVMLDFLDRAERLRAVNRIVPPDAYDDIKRAHLALREVHAKSFLDFNNIEHLYGALEMGRILGRVGSLSQAAIEKCRASVQRLIAATIEESIAFDLDADGEVMAPRPYGLLLEQLEKCANGKPRVREEAAFLTFNYDLCLEVALRIAGIGSQYHLPGARPGAGVALLKLHGSTNWLYCPECKHICAADLDDLKRIARTRDRGTCHYWLFGMSHKCPGCGVDLAPNAVIVPPTWSKTPHLADIEHVWSKAANLLAEAEAIIIIGYSFPETDSFFRYLYALGSVGEARIKRFVVVNPEAAVEPAFKGLVGQETSSRFSFIKSRFQEAISPSTRHSPVEGALLPILRECLS